MRNLKVSSLALAGAVLALSVGAAKAAPYHLQSVTPLKGAAPSWDYLSFDAARGYLFLGRRAQGVTIVDAATGKVVGKVERSEGANMATLVPDFDRGYTTNGDGTTTVFELSSLKTLDRVKLGEAADAAFYEPVTHQLAFTLGDTQELVFVDAKTSAITARVHMEAEELEGVVADGQGSIWVNERDKTRIAKVDARSHKQTAEYAIPGCDMPTGLAMDRASGRLFIGCKGEKPVLAVMDASNGKVVGTFEIGRGNDGVVYDPEGKRVFTSNGVDGNIVIFEQQGPDAYKLVQAVTTRPIARTMAFDPKTKRIFTMTAEGMVDPAKPVNRRAAPFYPNRFFDDTMTLLTYSAD